MKKTGAKRDKDCEHTVCAIANGVSQSLLADARQIIDTARANAVRSVDFNRVMMYWNLGRRIFEEEQQGKDWAEYGARVIRGSRNALNLSVVVVLAFANWSRAGSSTDFIQLRTHCMRN